MTYLSNVNHESSFGFILWLKWMLFSLIGWTALILSIMNFKEYILIFGGIFASSIFIGLIQWMNIRQVFPWAKLWLIVSIMMIPLGLTYAASLGTLIFAVGIAGGILGKELMGVVGGIFLPAISIAIAYVTYMFLTGIIVKKVSVKVEGRHLILLEQIVVIGFAVTIAVTLNVLVGLFDTGAGIFAGGVFFGLITGYGVNEIGLPTRWAQMETKN